MLAPPHSQQLIAIVEDDAAVLNSLEFSLQTQGYAVCSFAKAADALGSQEILGADCLVVDYVLPDLDGANMLLALRRRALACPAIMIASNPSLQCRNAATRVGARLLEKPLMGGVLEDAIRSALAGD